MPWKESSVEEERLRFVARLLNGESMTGVCRSFGISRKTGYKIFNRYKEIGPVALSDRSRRPVRYANQLPEQIERLIVEAKQGKPHWGARKIRELLVRRLNGDVRIPAKSTVHAVLDRHGLVKRAKERRRHKAKAGNPPGGARKSRERIGRRLNGHVRIPAKSTVHAVLDRHGLVKRAKERRRHKAKGTPLSPGQAPNDLWCVDFKGEFKLGNGRYCYPLTVTDHAARFILACEALESVKGAGVIPVFERLFKERGLPDAIRSDNGVPFASPNGLYNLSQLSVWWLRLGIEIERIKPGQPQQNGRHERMHLTLKKETTRPPRANILQQQARFDDFVSEFNGERPHDALAMKTPVEVYRPSAKPYNGLPEIDYPFHEIGRAHV